MASISCNIVVVPSASLAAKVIKCSERLERYGENQFVLKDGAFFPHATLYMCQIKVHDLEAVQKILAGIAAHTAAFSLVASRYDQTDGYIDAEYPRDALIGLQTEVLAAINPLRDGLRKNDEARVPEATGVIRENLEKYGYRGVGELFRPHITFTRFADNKIINTAELPPISDFNGTFDKLGLFEMGDNGTCVREIVEFPFVHKHN